MTKNLQTSSVFEQNHLLMTPNAPLHTSKANFKNVHRLTKVAQTSEPRTLSPRCLRYITQRGPKPTSSTRTLMEEAIGSETINTANPHNEGYSHSRLLDSSTTNENTWKPPCLVKLPISCEVHTDQEETIQALRQNIATLTTLHQGEKTKSDLLSEKLKEMTENFDQLHKSLENEILKHNLSSHMKAHKQIGTDQFLFPDISHEMKVAMQKYAQMELSYEQKCQSLDRKCLDVMENNQKLITKITLLEQSNDITKGTVQELQSDCNQLVQQIETLKSIIASQTEIIATLRKSEQTALTNEIALEQKRKEVELLRMEQEKSQSREVLLKQKLEHLQLTSNNKQLATSNQIMVFQKRAQDASTLKGEYLYMKDMITKLESEKLDATNNCNDAKTQANVVENKLQQQIKISEQLEQENEKLSETILSLSQKLKQLTDEHTENEVAGKQIKDESAPQEEVYDLHMKVIELETRLEKLQIANLKSMKDIGKLSQDEAVVALQRVRRQEGVNDALAIVSKEKQELQKQFDELHEKADICNKKLQATSDELARTNSVVTQLQNELNRFNTRHSSEMDTQSPLVVTSEKDEVLPNLLYADLQKELDRVKGELSKLQREYHELTFKNTVLSTKKYKTESFQSQAKLLANENASLSSRLADKSAELMQIREELNRKTIEVAAWKETEFDPETIASLRHTQESVEKTVETLIEAEAASEVTFTCLKCMNLFEHPITFVPCGHTFCKSCAQAMGDINDISTIQCTECCKQLNGNINVQFIFSNASIEDLKARFIFRQQMLTTLTSMCLSLRNSFANRNDISRRETYHRDGL